MFITTILKYNPNFYCWEKEYFPLSVEFFVVLDEATFIT